MKTMLVAVPLETMRELAPMLMNGNFRTLEAWLNEHPDVKLMIWLSLAMAAREMQPSLSPS